MNALLRNYLREHPTLILSVCYFLVTLIGVIYSHFFYREFGIAILKFADLSDFLLASILEPLSVVVFFGWALFYFFTLKLDHWLRRRYPKYGSFMENRLKTKYTDPILMSVAVLVLTVTFVKGFAINNADKIKAGKIDDYIAMAPNAEAEQHVALLGSSSRFSYMYNLATKEALVIPVESIDYLRKVQKPVAGPVEDKLKAPEVVKPQALDKSANKN